MNLYGVAPETEILTDKGWKLVKELTTTDRIYNETGKLTAISHISPAVFSEMKKITLETGNKVTVSNSQPWKTVNEEYQRLVNANKEMQQLYQELKANGKGESAVDLVQCEKFIGIPCSDFIKIEEKLPTFSEVVKAFDAYMSKMSAKEVIHEKAVSIHTTSTLHNELLSHSVNIKTFKNYLDVSSSAHIVNMEKEASRFIKGKTVHIDEQTNHTEKLDFIQKVLLLAGEASSNGTGRYYVNVAESNRQKLIDILASVGHTSFVLEPSKEIMFESEYNHYEGTHFSQDWSPAHKTFATSGLNLVESITEAVEQSFISVQITDGDSLLVSRAFIPVLSAPTE